jgi:hypothetical protein
MSIFVFPHLTCFLKSHFGVFVELFSDEDVILELRPYREPCRTGHPGNSGIGAAGIRQCLLRIGVQPLLERHQEVEALAETLLEICSKLLGTFDVRTYDV